MRLYRAPAVKDDVAMTLRKTYTQSGEIFDEVIAHVDEGLSQDS